MSTTQSTQTDEPDAELHEPPDYDPYYSGLASFVFHFCLFVLLPFLSAVVKSQDRLPPTVDVVQVVDAQMDGSETFSDLPSGLETQEQDTSAEMAIDVPTQEINKDIQVDVTTEFNESDIQQTADNAVKQARQAAAAAKAAAASALNDNLGGTAGSGGSGGTGRAGRAARWVLTFNTSNPQDYLRQLGGLGADVAFPAEGGKYKYFTNLAGTPTSSLRDLDKENRIYWMDERSFYEVARVLGVQADVMIAFLPGPLEDKMSKLEMARARERGVTREEDIIQTVFEYVNRGGGDIIIVDQKLK